MRCSCKFCLLPQPRFAERLLLLLLLLPPAVPLCCLAVGQYWPACFGPSPLPYSMSEDQFSRLIGGIALRFLYLGIGERVRCCLPALNHPFRAGCPVTMHIKQQHCLAVEQSGVLFAWLGLVAVAAMVCRSVNSPSLHPNKLSFHVICCPCNGVCFACRSMCCWRAAAGLLGLHQCAPNQQAAAHVPACHHAPGETDVNRPSAVIFSQTLPDFDVQK